MVLIISVELVKILLVFLLVAIIPVLIYNKLAFRYWKIRNVPQSHQPTFPLGTLPNPLTIKNHIAIIMKSIYDEAKARNYKLDGGFFMYTPKLLLIDREYIKQVLLQKFSYFVERGFYYNEKQDPLSANLFAIGGEKWRVLRKHMTPAFTRGKLKRMFENLLRCAYQMQEVVEKNYKNKDPIDLRNVCENFTIDVIGLCAFGLECNSLKNPNAEFKKQGKKIFHFTLWRVFKAAMAFIYPNFSRWFGVRLFDKNLTQFFTDIVTDTLEYRKRFNCSRNDFLQLLLDLKSENGLKNFYGNALEELTAQVFIFFAAGFETSSITLTFCLYELSKNVKLQQKLKKEINTVISNNDGKITYEGIMDMKYMDQVVEETLRKYPSVPYITRVCVNDYEIPETKIKINKGTDIFIPIMGLHHDSEYFFEPEKFDPERFNPENRHRIHPFAYLPFGEGPRMCIGMRFGLMQVKTGLAVLLHKYSFTLNKETRLPIEIDMFSFTLTPKQDIMVDVDKCT